MDNNFKRCFLRDWSLLKINPPLYVPSLLTFQKHIKHPSTMTTFITAVFIDWLRTTSNLSRVEWHGTWLHELCCGCHHYRRRWGGCLHGGTVHPGSLSGIIESWVAIRIPLCVGWWISNRGRIMMVMILCCCLSMESWGYWRYNWGQIIVACSILVWFLVWKGIWHITDACYFCD